MALHKSTKSFYVWYSHRQRTYRIEKTFSVRNSIVTPTGMYDRVNVLKGIHIYLKKTMKRLSHNLRYYYSKYILGYGKI